MTNRLADRNHDRMHRWLGEALREARGDTPHRVVGAAIGTLPGRAAPPGDDTLRRLENGGWERGRLYGWPDRLDEIVAGYARVTGQRPLELWARALALWLSATGGDGVEEARTLADRLVAEAEMAASRAAGSRAGSRTESRRTRREGDRRR